MTAIIHNSLIDTTTGQPVTDFQFDAFVHEQVQKSRHFSSPPFVNQTVPLEGGAVSHGFYFSGPHPEEPVPHTRGVATPISQRATAQKTITLRPANELAEAIDQFDQAILKWDVLMRGQARLIEATEVQLNKRAIRVGINGARSAAIPGVHEGGVRVTRSGADLATAYPMSSTGATQLLNDILELGRRFSDMGISEEGRSLAINQWLLNVAMQGNLVNRDFTNAEDGFLPTRFVGRIGNFRVFIANDSEFPKTEITNEVPEWNGDYRVNGAFGLPAIFAVVNDPRLIGIAKVEKPSPAARVWKEDPQSAWMTRSVAWYGIDFLSPSVLGVVDVVAP